MTEEPEDLTLRFMRDIRAKLDGHDKRFDSLDKRFDKTLEEMRHQVTYALGPGTATHLRVNELDERQDEADRWRQRMDGMTAEVEKRLAPRPQPEG